MNPYLPAFPRILLLLTLICLTACHQDNPAPEPKATSPALPKDEILLPLDSAKRAYLRETKLVAMPAPLMEPVAGKLAYDETRTARVSSPLAGRVISGLPELGTATQAGAPLLELDSPDLGQAAKEYADAQADQTLAEQAFEREKKLFRVFLDSVSAIARDSVPTGSRPAWDF